MIAHRRLSLFQKWILPWNSTYFFVTQIISFVHRHVMLSLGVKSGAFVSHESLIFRFRVIRGQHHLIFFRNSSVLCSVTRFKKYRDIYMQIRKTSAFRAQYQSIQKSIQSIFLSERVWAQLWRIECECNLLYMFIWTSILQALSIFKGERGILHVEIFPLFALSFTWDNGRRVYLHL